MSSALRRRALGSGQRGGGRAEVGLGRVDRLEQLVDHALRLGVAKLLELLLKLSADGAVQGD